MHDDIKKLLEECEWTARDQNEEIDEKRIRQLISLARKQNEALQEWKIDLNYSLREAKRIGVEQTTMDMLAERIQMLENIFSLKSEEL